MARPTKKRAQAERQPQGSSSGSSSASRDPTQRSVVKSIPRLDGNRDPAVASVLEYTRPTDLKNISEFLGLAGWYAARGVSTNTLLSQLAYACTFPNKHSQSWSWYANKNQSARWYG
jgi:eukaryotic translation initiation factor 2C